MRYLHLLLSLLLCFQTFGQVYQSVYLDEGKLQVTGTALDTLWVEDEALHNLEATNLTSLNYLAVYNNPALTNANFSALKAHTGDSPQPLYLAENPSLRTVNLAALATVSGAVRLDYNPSLVSVNLDKLVFVSQYISFALDTSLTSISLPALISVGTSPFLGFFASGASSLTNVSFPKYLPTNGRLQDFSGCALTEAGVDHVLARCVASKNYVSGTVKVNGGTSASPSAAGLADVATLQTRGVTVNHN